VDMRPHSPLDAFFHVPKSRGLASFFTQPLVDSPVSWSQDVEISGRFSRILFAAEMTVTDRMRRLISRVT
jgi:hypothetical protein